MPSGLPLDRLYMGRILNFAHRGASHDAPENTLAAFQLAIQHGADGIELDVVLTQDGYPVVIHNENVDQTTDGVGPVAGMTLAQIKALDAGSHFGAQFAGERVPTLVEVFEAVGDRLLINIELKGLSMRADGLEAAVADLIRRHAMQDRVMISSFNPLRLRRMRRVAPEIPVGFLHDSETPGYLQALAAALMLGVRAESDHPQDVLVTPEYLARMRSHCKRVNVWVVNEPDRMRKFRDMGVDMIMTDRPDVLRAVLHGEQ